MSHLPYRGPWMLTCVDDQADPPNGGELCPEFLLARLRCPIIATGHVQHHLNHLCEIAWLRHCTSYQIDREASYFLDPNDLDQDISWAFAILQRIDNGPEEACVDAHNIASWYAVARRDFIEKLKPLTVDIADENKYPKHYPPPAARNEAEFVRASGAKGDPSILHPRITVDVQAELLADIQTDVFDQIVDGSVSRCSLKCNGVVGYSEGKAVTFLAVEWSESGLAHCYPITEAHAARLEGPHLKSMTRY